MNHRARFDAALRALPAANAAYLARVAHELDRRPEMEDRAHLLYPVLAEAAPTIEPVLTPQEAADAVLAFLLREAEGIAAALYAPAYLATPGAVLAPFSARLRAELAGMILDRLAAGRLSPPDRRVWRIRTDRDAAAFPYGGEDEEA